MHLIDGRYYMEESIKRLCKEQGVSRKEFLKNIKELEGCGAIKTKRDIKRPDKIFIAVTEHELHKK
ncbi:hypothetical protein [Bacillus cereus]|uniref:hypothetical protein n=1 Tax=Bacillus cereus TaxID=1396 RepID=UPI00192D22E8|nr:hypothetical protein [Bacillus cereus]